MSVPTFEEMQHGQVVVSVARALSVASQTVLRQGTNPANPMITISEEPSSAGRSWRVHYGPRDYINRRGGDLIVVVDEALG